MTYFALRKSLYFDAVADVQPTNQSMPGSSVIFNQTADLAVATATLNESTDLTPATMSDSQVTVTLLEKGNVVGRTAKLGGTSYIPVDPVMANLIGFNAGSSLDAIAADVLAAGSNVAYATGGGTTPTARNTVEPGDTLTAHDVRVELARLRAAFAAPFGTYYAAFIHPDVSLDLKEETGSASWTDPHTYSQPEEIWTGEIGMFSGFRFVETASTPMFADAGSSTTLTDVYATLFMGRQALAKAYSTTDGNGAMPKVVLSPVTDLLARFRHIGWYWLGGYARFREASLRRVESSSSIGTNS